MRQMIYLVGQFTSNLIHGVRRPIAAPIHHTTIEQCRRSRSTILQALRGGVHREHHVKIPDDLPREPAIQFFRRVQHQSIPVWAFLALSHQSGVLVALKQSGDLSVGQESVHPLEEARFQDVGLIEDEADFFVTATGAPQDTTEIFVEISAGVLAMNLFNLKRKLFRRIFISD